MTAAQSGARGPRRLYVFSPMPPQRNGLADYLMAYLPRLAAEHEVWVVAASDQAPAVQAARPAAAPWRVLDEAGFRARQPDPEALVLYNLGNNSDCVYMLDHLPVCPGAVLLHDISLFHLHQLAAEQGWMGTLMDGWLADDGHAVPRAFVRRDGALARTPGLLYQECLMLRRLLQDAPGVLVHTRYAEGRLLGAVPSLPLARLTRLPHFVAPAEPLPPARVDEVLARHGVTQETRLLLVPGFLTGNKMLYEILAAFRQVQAEGLPLHLLFAGEERPDEYALSRRIADWWPTGGGPTVTGYLDAQALDILLARADLSLVLRYPTYGESSGILPRAALGGGRVLTVDIGAYPEFVSPWVTPLRVGPGLVDSLTGAMRALAVEPPLPVAERQARQQAEVDRQAALSPAALYPAWRDWLHRCAVEVGR